MLNWIKTYLLSIVMSFAAAGVFATIAINTYNKSKEISDIMIPEVKTGIQNHLVWDIKGQCFFVQNSKENVALIPVPDCDKKG